MDARRVACITCNRTIDADSDALPATPRDGETACFCSVACAATNFAAGLATNDCERPELQDWPPIVKAIGRAITENFRDNV